MIEKTYHVQTVERKGYPILYEVRDNKDICHGRYRKEADASSKLRWLRSQLELEIE